MRPHPLNEWWLLNRDATSVRRVVQKHGESFSQAMDRFLEAMPRKPFKFLAMVKEAEKRRKAIAAVDQRKQKNRARYQKRMKQRAAISQGKQS